MHKRQILTLESALLRKSNNFSWGRSNEFTWAGFGMFLCTFGFLSFAFIIVEKHFNAPPMISELRPVSGYLGGQVEVFRPAKSTGRAQLNLVTPEGRKCIWIDDVNFLWHSDERHPLVELKPGSPLTVYLVPRERLAWEVRTDNVTLLSYDQMRKADRIMNKRITAVGAFLLVLGALCLLWSRKQDDRRIA